MSDNKDNNWEVVLSGSLEDRRRVTLPPGPIEELELETGVVERQFVKFDVLSFYGQGGGLEYFDVVRTGPRQLKTEAELSTSMSRTVPRSCYASSLMP